MSVIFNKHRCGRDYVLYRLADSIVRIILWLIAVGLVATAIAMELLPEDEAKVYVIPILVAALFACIAQYSNFRTIRTWKN